MARWIQSLEQRFWSKVNRNGPALRPELGPCWVWTAGQFQGNRGGCPYGQFRVPKPDGSGHTHELAHRVAYRLARGPFDRTLFVLHRCDHGLCVRPDHLFLGTHQANMDDMMAKGRHGETGPKHPLFGSRNPASKLTEPQVVEIRQRRRDGESGTSVAAAFGIHREHVYRLTSGKRWGHLPSEVCHR